MNIYKIIHFYNIDHDKYAFFIQTEMTPQVMIETLASLDFKFEELVDESSSLDPRHLLSLLVDFFEVEDVTREYRKYLPQTQLEDYEWKLTNTFSIVDGNEKIKIIQIDQYRGRESCCGPDIAELMEKRLPKTKALEKEIMDVSYYPRLNGK